MFYRLICVHYILRLLAIAIIKTYFFLTQEIGNQEREREKLVFQLESRNKNKRFRNLFNTFLYQALQNRLTKILDLSFFSCLFFLFFFVPLKKRNIGYILERERKRERNVWVSKKIPDQVANIIESQSN